LARWSPAGYPAGEREARAAWRDQPSVTNNVALLALAFLALVFVCLAHLYWGLRELKPGMVMACVFFLTYLLARPFMLLSGVHGKFALLHSFPGTWSLDAVWRLWVLSGAMMIIFFAAYHATRPEAIALRAAALIASTTENLRSLVLVWVVALAVYVSGKVFEIGAAMLPYGFLMFGICLLLLRGSGRSRDWLLTAAGLLLTLVVLLCTEERRDWAVGVFAVGWIMVFLRRRSLGLGIVLGVAMLGILAGVAIALRSASQFLDKAGSTKQQMTVLSLIEWDLDFPLVYDDLIILVKQVPERHDYLYGASLSKPFIFWIPRDLWPGKPETFSRQVSHVMNTSFYRNGGSEPLTFVGELYWNFGWFALLFAPLLGGMQRMFDEIFAIGQQLKGLWPKTGSTVLAGGLILTAMTFYVLRGPIDTVWLSYAGFVIGMTATGLLRRLI
jgi:hypothetical protein